MKINIYTSIIVALLLGFFSCSSNDNDLNQAEGYLQISSIKSDNTIIQTKSGGSQISFDIWKGTEKVKHVEDWTTVEGENLKLAVGSYTIKAYSSGKDGNQQGFDAGPIYAAEQNFTIEKNVAKNISLTCTLSQTMVSVSYSDNFKSMFNSYSAEVSNSDGSVAFAKEETRPAYFISGGTINSKLTFTNSSNVVKVFEQAITTDAKKQYHYKIVYDISNNGNGDFNLTVDQSTQEYHITITVPKDVPSVVTAATTKDANPFGKFAYLSGEITTSATFDGVVEFQYRKAASNDPWQSVIASLENNLYVAKTDEIDFATSYEYKIVADSEEGELKTFTTEVYEEIPNLNMDTWKSNGRSGGRLCWYANPIAGHLNQAGAYWASGNEGTSGLFVNKGSVTTPTTTEVIAGTAARLSTVTGVSVAGAAAGNLYIGTFKTDIGKPANSVGFGRPYTGARPTKLSGFYKYYPKDINYGTYPEDRPDMTIDECHIYIKLWDSEDNELGYGEFITNEEFTSYQKFNIDITYDPQFITNKPAKITIVATSSRYGGVFENDNKGSKVIGKLGEGSTLYIDELELSYYK